ncbi:SAM-dependent methyltransferase [Marinitenerispora sediminis]|uniref:SAM-dependent methyltransferase n=2 Tax=Marinitenerispora sediminis TaxID=1931232 RepID=A0A368T2B8_9ACTN|nr:SAM-dependent methyltransferase [Marinitenerispora sediminis]RCV51486.1 SAM-dependent methyltransferase [Marinitenerispora sediminis]RCV55227.1 SAM-dependent methyltransferase [Marinitenerispora sediminis]
MRGSADPPPPKDVDTTTPSFARVYDYFLGGKDNFEVDRAVGDKVLALVPEASVVAQGNRTAIERAVRYLAGEVGIDQFVDIGSGLPTTSNVHQFATAVNPRAHVVYVDNDPIVLAHGRALLAEDGVATVIQADLLQPEKIFESPELRALIDLSRPVAIILAAIIHHVPDEQDPRAVVRRLHDFVAPGSHFVLTHLHDSGDDPSLNEAKRLIQRDLGGSIFRSPEQIRSFLDGLEILEPGVVPVTAWRPNGPSGELEHPLHTQMVAALARRN